MATQAQSSSPFSRLSRLAFPFKTNPSTPLTAEPQNEDWYIPYNGPYEPPKDERNTDSWGHLVSGWLMENDSDRSLERGPRARAVSNASRAAPADDHKRKSTRFQASFIKLDQAGGVGAVPTPLRAHRSPESPPAQHRASLASILSFASKKTPKLHHSPSAGSLRTDPVPPIPQDPRLESNPQSPSPLRHPYAYAYPAVPPPPVSTPVLATPSKNPPATKFSVQLLDPLARKPTAPAYLLPGRRPSKLSLKASMSTPNLRAATGTTSVLPKGKQRWLSAETWCDALILPRPRFALRVIDGEEGSGRIVSPPGSPIWPSGEHLSERPALEPARILKKSHSATQLAPPPPARLPPSPPRPPPRSSSPVHEEPVAGPSNVPQGTTDAPQSQLAVGNGHNAHLKPYRPKSWAWDDLAIPSPVPSLSKVLEDGRKLAEDRKTWKREASKSFADKRAGSLSRARSKSIGSRTHAREPSSAFDTIAEVTLLGSQRRRPTVHVRVRPPRSDGQTSSSGGGTNTVTGTGTGVATLTSTSHAQQTRSRSHAHSNSLGSISQPRSEESFMWAPGHGRNHSLGKSALRIVRTTATSAAALCGLHEVQSEDGRQHGRHLDDKAAAMEAALRQDGTKVIHLRDQVARGGGSGGGPDGVVMITPPSVSHSHSHSDEQHAAVGPNGLIAVSPTPSNMSASAEGIGLAIGSPLPQEDPFEKMPIRIPAHPYAQGAVHPYYQRSTERPPGKAPILPGARRSEASAPSPTSTMAEDGASITKYRQPVVVHPYSPYTQVQHPFAAITGEAAAPKTKHERLLSPKSKMYAELSPGKIREILPEEIQYSPNIPTPPLRVAEFQAASTSTSSGSGHPYGPSTHRTSEWGFAEALSSTLQRRGSTDSGVGTSETHGEAAPLPERPTFAHVLQDSDDMIIISPEDEDPDAIIHDLGSRSRSGSTGFVGRRRPRLHREATQASSNHTLASSPMDSINPSVFRPDVSVGDRSFASSGSSPGMVSTQSSPPHSPRPINATDDLERFRDLFFRPPETKTPSSEESRPSGSRRPSGGSIPIEIGSRSTRSLSGLTSLARQLSVSMSEMQEGEDEGEGASPMWGARYGAASRRPSDLGPDPPEIPSRSPSSSRSGFRADNTQSPLRLPIDESLVLSQPIDVVPEDVESSRASSMLELPMDEEYEDVDVRLGEIEAVSTPPVSDQIQRFSTHLVHSDTGASPSDHHFQRVVSQQSSLGPPVSSDAARSSFMTATSGMSRLSDFPAPPSQITASHLSILNAYYGGGGRNQGEDPTDSRPGLVREASQATFGSRAQMGEAL